MSCVSMLRVFALSLLLAPLALSQTPPGFVYDQNILTESSGSADGVGPLTGAPSASNLVSLRQGHVDAVTGNIHLNIPLGRRLPGRIPVGFSWVFDSLTGKKSELSGASSPFHMGGQFSPIVWPAMRTNQPQHTVWVNGKPLTFLKVNHARYMPTLDQIKGWLKKRGMDTADALLNVSIFPSADGSRFLIMDNDLPRMEACPDYWKNVKFNYAILDGDQAIWTNNFGGMTYIANLWGDRVSIRSEWQTIDLGHYSNGMLVCSSMGLPLPGVPAVVTITNERYPEHWIRLEAPRVVFDENLTQPILTPVTISITSSASLRFPKVSLSGNFKMGFPSYIEGTGTDANGNSTFIPLRLFPYEFGYLPETIQYEGQPALIFSWSTSKLYLPPGVLLGGPVIQLSNTPLKSITHPNGLKESFGYVQGHVQLSANSFDPYVSGEWTGFDSQRPFTPKTPSNQNPWLANGGTSDVDQAVYSITYTGPGVNQAALLAPNWPTMAYDSAYILKWVQPDHCSSILYYPTSTPTAETPFRGVRLIHPSGNSWTDPASPQAYLFATSAILMSERIHGVGLPTPIFGATGGGGIRFNDRTGLTGFALPASTVDETTIFEGWSLRSWANPGLPGNPDAMPNIPVNPEATRVSTYRPGLPTTLKQSGLWDTAKDLGYTRLTQYTLPPQVLGALSPRSQSLWESALPGLQACPVVQTAITTRDRDALTGLILTKTEDKTLEGSALTGLRTVTSVPVDLGSTTYDHDELGRLKSAVTSRYGSTTKETRNYLGTIPWPQDISQSVFLGGVEIPANLDLFSVKVGKTTTFDMTSPFQWPTSETNKVDGRPTVINERDGLGRVTRLTDPNGNVTETEFDDWGRLKLKTRLPRGTEGAAGYVGAVSTEYTYDDVTAGRWREETLKAEGKSLTTRYEMDAFGRVTHVRFPDGSTQDTTFDGFGQQVFQSPLLKPGQTPYGNFEWTYDAQGRLATHRRFWDAPGVNLSEVICQPTWETKTIEGQTIRGVFTTVRDDRGFSRSTVTDLLGQKVAVVDQKGQVSRYFYDRDGHLSRTEQGNQMRRYVYNDMGWLLSREEPEEGTTVYSGHNALGMPKTTTLQGRNGQGQETTRVTLDTHLRPVLLTAQAAGTTLVSRTITYRDDFYLPSSVSEGQPYGSFQETYTYDQGGRVTGKTITDGSQTFTISRDLDALGNVLTLTYPQGGGQPAKDVITGYDDLFRSNNLTYGSGLRASIEYDQVSGTAVTSVLTLGATGSLVKTTSRVDRGDLTQVVHANATDTQTFGLSWTPGGLLTQRGSDKFEYDALQRLTHVEVGQTPGLSAFTEIQDFDYDRWGNRIASRSRNISGEFLSEVRAWSASYDATNELPRDMMELDGTGKATGSTLATGAVYDNAGRLTDVLAVPGDQSTYTHWGYDPMGRVVRENGTTFLLDSEGLRFKRMKVDGSITYTVYGFNREALATFEKVAAVPLATKSSSTMKAAALASSTRAGTTQAAAAVIIPPVDPEDCQVVSTPVAKTVWVGASVLFNANGRVGTNPRYHWQFGDGTGATSATRSCAHGFTRKGTFAVTVFVTSAEWSGSATSIITVIDPPVITLNRAAPATIYRESSANNPWPTASTLSWTVLNTDQLSLDNGIGVVTGTTSRVVSPIQNTTYTLTATNAGGAVSATVAVAVESMPPPCILSLSQSAIVVKPGEAVALSWAAENYDTFSLYDPVALRDVLAPVGTATGVVVRPAQNTTYTLKATNVAGTVSRDVSVAVAQKPVIEAFLGSPARIAPGQATTLTWGVTNYASLWIDGIGDVTANATGTLSVSPGTTTQYTLIATNAQGSVMASVTVTVGAASTKDLVWKKNLVYGFGQLVSEETPEGVRYIQGDQVGTPNTILDSTGAVIGRSKNLPFGERLGQSGEKSFRRFTNHENGEGSPIYMQARTYLPAYGKFAQVDPEYDQNFGDPETWNLYNYVTNNPVTHTDPDGREEIKPDVTPEKANEEQKKANENDKKWTEEGKQKGTPGTTVEVVEESGDSSGGTTQHQATTPWYRQWLETAKTGFNFDIALDRRKIDPILGGEAKLLYCSFHLGITGLSLEGGITTADGVPSSADGKYRQSVAGPNFSVKAVLAKYNGKKKGPNGNSSKTETIGPGFKLDGEIFHASFVGRQVGDSTYYGGIKVGAGVSLDAQKKGAGALFFFSKQSTSSYMGQ